MSKLRIVLRLIAFLAVTVGVYLIWSAGQLVCLHAHQRRLAWRNWAFGTWARLMCRVIGLRVSQRGPLPKPPFLLVTNHLSYLDVIVIAAQVNCTLVAKQQVATWPLLGAMARRIGIIFLDRANIADVSRTGEVMRSAIQDGQGVVLFPEGTSSPGQRVLPFYSPLFEPVVRLGLPVSYASLSYRSPAPARPAHLNVCWWGDMTFLDHLLGLFALPYVEADVHFGAAPVYDGDRKRLAKRLHAEINQIFIPSAAQDASLDYAQGPAWLKATGH
ncbi:MAG: 1-acyl-sn-glycerol-3-phosphate acyltransferase [Anaerolineae bacterium]|nr:1-acyl-sn-glycerol-3-phosphate acyltransferase [Anaerolineae bacterium]